MSDLRGPTDILRAHFSEQRDRIFDLCADLVAAPSVNPPGDTRAVALVLQQFLLDHGVRADLAIADPAMPSVLARVDSGKPGPRLVMNVHLDTMPPGPLEAWSVPPFELTRKNGRLYGLGMGNMKGAVAAMAFALTELSRRREEWAGSITFTAVSDEVVFGANGAQFLLESMPELPGDALICGEGAGFRRLAIGEKGVLWLAIEVTGDPGHSSAVQRGRSASARIAAITEAIDGLNGRAVAPDPAIVDPETAFVLTANVGTLAAGTFVGQIATNATAEVDLRVPPGMTLNDVETLVREEVDAAVGPGVAVISRIKGWEANTTRITTAIGQAWLAAAAAAGTGEPELAVRLPASDASRWRRLGVPALCYGPQPGLSAGVDDYAEEQDVLDCALLYTLTALQYLRKPDEDRRG